MRCDIFRYQGRNSDILCTTPFPSPIYPLLFLSALFCCLFACIFRLKPNYSLLLGSDLIFLGTFIRTTQAVIEPLTLTLTSLSVIETIASGRYICLEGNSPRPLDSFDVDDTVKGSFILRKISTTIHSLFCATVVDPRPLFYFEQYIHDNALYFENLAPVQ